MTFSSSGSNFVTRKAQNQLKQNVMEADKRLASGEKISALTVHGKGPKPRKIFFQLGLFKLRKSYQWKMQ